MIPLQLLLYVSSASHPLSTTELDALLAQSRNRNAQLGITGLLLYRDGNFMQAIEGPEESMRTVYASILRDPRHHDVISVIDMPVAARSFPDWAMGDINLDIPGRPQILGRSDGQPVPLDSLVDVCGAIVLLCSFCDQFGVGPI